MNLRTMVLAVGLALVLAGCGDDVAEETTTQGTEDTSQQWRVDLRGRCDRRRGCCRGKSRGRRRGNRELARAMMSALEPSSPCVLSICEPATNTCAEKALTDGASCQVGAGSCVFVGQCTEGECVERGRRKHSAAMMEMCAPMTPVNRKLDVSSSCHRGLLQRQRRLCERRRLPRRCLRRLCLRLRRGGGLLL